MKRETEIKLENVFKYPLFQSVGRPITSPSLVSSVDSWRLAANECCTTKWVNCRTMARNALQGLVEQRCWSRTNDWNPLADELRPLIVSFVESALPNSAVPQKIAEKIKHKIAWDIMFICLEHEYRDVVNPLFYIPLLDPWYAAGHFPCGWDGAEFPEDWDGVIVGGKVIVF